MREEISNATVVLSVPVTATDEPSLLNMIREVVDRREPTVFVGLYASLFRQLRTDPEYRALVDRSVTYPDGYGIVRELRKRGVETATRLATTDVIHPIVRTACASGWRVVLYGAAPGVAERAAKTITATTPNLWIVGIWDGFSGGPSQDELVELRPDVVIVGLGAGMQERWSYEVAIPAGVPAVLTCGGLFDFLAGDKRRAPMWMQRAGLEWVFRMGLEPRRLVGRYARGNVDFMLRARVERSALARDGVNREAPPGRPRAGLERLFTVRLEPRRLVARHARGNLGSALHAGVERSALARDGVRP
jgi:N-acetylglucosaminyldiphosphoundecaprenol N-acetyl-beta-D-mannosaminyltransferase